MAATCSKIGQHSEQAQSISNATPQPVAIVGGPGGAVMTTPTSGLQAQIAQPVQQLGGASIVTAGQLLQNIPLQGNASQMVAAPVTGPNGAVAYNVVQQPTQQQVMALKVQTANGQEQTILAPVAMPGSAVQVGQSTQPVFQLGQNANGQAIVIQNNGQILGAGAQQTSNNQPLNLSNSSVSGTQYMCVRQGNVVQTIPVFQPSPTVQTVPIQIPIGTLNGQTVYQTMQVPTQCIQPVLQSSGSGVLQLSQQNVVDIPSLIQNAALMVPGQDGQTQDKISAKALNQVVVSNDGVMAIKEEPESAEVTTPGKKKSKRKSSEPKHLSTKINSRDAVAQSSSHASNTPTTINTAASLNSAQTVESTLDTLQQAIVQAGVQSSQQSHIILPARQLMTSCGDSSSNSMVLTSSGLQSLQGVQIVGAAGDASGQASSLVQGSGCVPQLLVQNTANGAQVLFSL